MTRVMSKLIEVGNIVPVCRIFELCEMSFFGSFQEVKVFFSRKEVSPPHLQQQSVSIWNCKVVCRHPTGIESITKHKLACHIIGMV